MSLRNCHEIKSNFRDSSLDPKSDFRMFHNFVIQNYVQSAEKEDGKIVLTARPPKMTQIVQDADSEAKINI